MANLTLQGHQSKTDRHLARDYVADIYRALCKILSTSDQGFLSTHIRNFATRVVTFFRFFCDVLSLQTQDACTDYDVRCSQQYKSVAKEKAKGKERVSREDTRTGHRCICYFTRVVHCMLTR